MYSRHVFMFTKKDFELLLLLLFSTRRNLINLSYWMITFGDSKHHFYGNNIFSIYLCRSASLTESI